jgi:hypothetical protein
VSLPVITTPLPEALTEVEGAEQTPGAEVHVTTWEPLPALAASQRERNVQLGRSRLPVWLLVIVIV